MGLLACLVRVVLWKCENGDIVGCWGLKGVIGAFERWLEESDIVSSA